MNATSADFRTLKRAWPGVAATSSAVIDDVDQAVAYTGDWFTASEARYLSGNCRVATKPESSVELSFVGTRIDWYGLKNTDLGRADVYLDGALFESGVELYDQKRQNAQLFSVGGLALASHTLKVVMTGEKHPESSGAGLVHDYFITYVDP